MNRYAIVLAGLLGSSGLASAGMADLFDEKVKDFGTTPRGPMLVHYFRFTNTTGKTITIGNPRVSCGCTSASMLQYTLQPGQTTAVVAMMDTRRIPTPYTTKSVIVYVPFQSPNWEEVALRVQTVTRDDLIFSPDTINLGTLRKGQGGKASTRVTFTSDPKWEVTGSTSTGGYVKVDHKLVSRDNGQVVYEVAATLDADCPVGNWLADVNLTTSNAGVAKLRIPVTVNVVAPISVSTEQVQLGDIPLGGPVEHRVIIQSSSPFKVLDVTGTDEQVAVKPDTTEAKPVHVLTLSATPKILGAFAKTVEVMTDNQEQPKISLAVVGKVISK